MHAVREEARGRRHILGVPPLRRQAQAVRRMREAGNREVRGAAGAAAVRLTLVRPTPLALCHSLRSRECMCRVRNRWGEPVFKFIACILQHARDRYYIAGDDDSWLDIKYWVCAYANNQHSYASLSSNSPCL